MVEHKRWQDMSDSQFIAYMQPQEATSDDAAVLVRAGQLRRLINLYTEEFNWHMETLEHDE